MPAAQRLNQLGRADRQLLECRFVAVARIGQCSVPPWVCRLCREVCDHRRHCDRAVSASRWRCSSRAFAATMALSLSSLRLISAGRSNSGSCFSASSTTPAWANKSAICCFNSASALACARNSLVDFPPIEVSRQIRPRHFCRADSQPSQAGAITARPEPGSLTVDRCDLAERRSQVHGFGPATSYLSYNGRRNGS